MTFCKVGCLIKKILFWKNLCSYLFSKKCEKLFGMFSKQCRYTLSFAPVFSHDTHSLWRVWRPQKFVLSSTYNLMPLNNVKKRRWEIFFAFSEYLKKAQTLTFKFWFSKSWKNYMLFQDKSAVYLTPVEVKVRTIIETKYK